MTHIAALQLIGQSEDVVAALSVFDDPEAQVGYGVTAMFEAFVISWLQEARISAAAWLDG